MDSHLCERISTRVGLSKAVVDLLVGNLVRQGLAIINNRCIFSIEESLLVSKLITELASISISSFQQIEFGGECKGSRASLIAHSSASKLLAQPIDLVNPFIHMLDRLSYAHLHQKVQDSYGAHITIVGQNQIQMPDRQCMMQSREGMGGTYRLQAMLPKRVYITDSIRKPTSHQYNWFKICVYCFSYQFI